MTTTIRSLARQALCQISGVAAAMLLLCAALLAAPAAAQDVAFKNFSEVRVTGPVIRESSGDNFALIIYNSNYEDDAISDLAVTELDARAMEKLFLDMGYPQDNIMVLGDGTKREILDQILFFTEKLNDDSSVVIYYSGHGITFEGDPSNYIVPVDMSAESKGGNQSIRERYFKSRAVNFNLDVLGVIKEAGPKGVVVFYDACRNSPLASADKTKSVGQEQGFVPAKVEGTAIFYSARNGETSLAALSSNDDVRLSVYTRVLITELSRNPSIRLSDLHRELQSTVARMARNKPGGSHSQNPVMENGLDYSRSDRNEFCLALADVNGVQGCTGPDGVPIPVAPDDLTKFCSEAPIRGSVRLIPTIAQARKERDTYIQCDDLREEISARIADLSWEETKAENTCASYRAYLQFHPDSSHSDAARQKEADACRQMSQAEIRTHVVTCETTAARLGFATFGMQQAEIEAAGQSCAIAATDPSVDSRQISFHHAVIMLALGQTERALDALKFAAGTVPAAALKLGDTLSSEEIPLPQRDLPEALFWYERAASSSSVSADDQRRALFRVVELQNELGNPSAAMDAYALLIQRANQARPILSHLRQFPEGMSGRLSPSDVYELLYFRFPDGALAYQIGEAWETGVHGGANLEQARVWYTRAQERGYARAQSKLDGMAGGGGDVVDGTQLWNALIACLEQAEARALNDEQRAQRGMDCTDDFLARADRSNPDRAQVEEHREALQAELASYQKPDGNALGRFLNNSSGGGAVDTRPPANPWEAKNGSYSGLRGYTDSGRRSPGAECLSQYNFTAEVRDGTISFWSDNRTFTGQVDLQGNIAIDRTGLSPRSKTEFWVEGHVDNARMYSGYCGSGYFRLTGY